MKVKRFDTFEIQKDNVVWAQTPEGYLKFENLIATTTGEFPYKKDGQIVYEKRTPEEVFKQEHLDSFVGKSITLLENLGHPTELLNPENDMKYSCGTILTAERKDEDKLAIAGVIKEPNAIKKIKSNIMGSKDKKIDAYEGSCGYTLELDDRNDGLYQTNLYCNHFSIVSKGRAGAITKLNRDYSDTEEDGQNSANDQNTDNQKTSDTNTTNDINSAKNMSEELKQENESLKTQLAEANAKLDSAIKAQLDEATAKNALQENLHSLKSRIDEMDAQNKKKELIEKAKSLGIKVDEALKDVNLDSTSPRDLAVKLIRANDYNGNFNNIDTASDDYIMGVLGGLVRVNTRNDSLEQSLSGFISKQDGCEKGFNEVAIETQNSNFNK